jgi:hypothetical protein
MPWVAIYTPSRCERYFLEIGSKARGCDAATVPEQMQALDHRYGIRYLR